jgi:alkylation response protein AidB-like acyl-CoA dehydrogenase
MRWLGIARRAQDIAVARACQRRLFGSRLGELGMVQQMIADNEIDIAASRGLILQACWELDQTTPSSTTTTRPWSARSWTGRWPRSAIRSPTWACTWSTPTPRLRPSWPGRRPP